MERCNERQKYFRWFKNEDKKVDFEKHLERLGVVYEKTMSQTLP